jgi:nucleotide-binding universal stress UspA family protein
MKQLFKTIVCPVDLEAPTRSALQMTRELAEQNEARIFLVHVVRPPLPGPIEAAPGLETQAKSKLEEIGGKVFGDKVQWEASVVKGEASSAVIRAAKDLGADLIVMATHRYTGLNRVLLGSVTELVVRESPIPVLTLGPECK